MLATTNWAGENVGISSVSVDGARARKSNRGRVYASRRPKLANPFRAWSRQYN